jgi:DNA primase
VENQVEEIKKKIDIVEYIHKFIPLRKRGRHFVACCPFHTEKTPSFIVSPELQIYKCFGCGKGGDIFSFVQEYDRIEFREALEELAKIAGITLKKSAPFTKEESQAKRLLQINEEIAKFYHYILTSHPLGKLALAYLSDRGIKASTIKLFKIGYSPENAALLINYLKKKGFSEPDLIATGTLGQSNYSRRLYDRFQGRLTFPLADYRNRILGFSGRILPTTQNQNSAKYINSPETPLYHKSHTVFGLNHAKEAIRQADSVLVVEGEFDMISPFQSGVKNVVAIKGTAFTEDQLRLLRRYTTNLILGLDSDFAGNNAAVKSIEMAENLDFDTRVLVLDDDYKDPDEAVKADPEKFKEKFKQAVPIGDFLITSAIKNFGIDTPSAKKKVMEMVLPFLVKIKSPVIQNDYLRQLATAIGSDYQSMVQESRKHQGTKNTDLNPPSPKITASSQEPAATSNLIHLQESLLVLLLGSRNPSKVAKSIQKHLQLITDSRYKAIIEQLFSHDVFDPHTFQEKLPPEYRQIFQNLYLEATSQTLESLVRRNQIKKTANLITTILIKEEMKQISTKIAQTETTHQEDELKKLELEYNKLLERLSRLQNQKTL